MRNIKNDVEVCFITAFDVNYQALRAVSPTPIYGYQHRVIWENRQNPLMYIHQKESEIEYFYFFVLYLMIGSLPRLWRPFFSAIGFPIYTIPTLTNYNLSYWWHRQRSLLLLAVDLNVAILKWCSHFPFIHIFNFNIRWFK